MGAGGALVVPQRGEPSSAQSLREQPTTAVGSRKERGIPVAVGRAAAGHQHDSREGTGTLGMPGAEGT